MIKIYVDKFWLGVLLTIVLEIIVVMVVAFIDMKRMDGDDNEKHP